MLVSKYALGTRFLAQLLVTRNIKFKWENHLIRLKCNLQRMMGK